MKTTMISHFTFSLQILHALAGPLAPRADTATSASSLICNKAGWDKGTESFASVNSGGYHACSTACFADSRCKSFAYTFVDQSVPEGDCQLYTTTLKDNFVEDGGSPYTFYDAGCEKASNICGQKGWYTDHYAYVWYDMASFPDRQNVQWCYEQCRTSEGNCRSFHFDPYHCALYDVPLIGNFEQSDQSGRAYYDSSCGSAIGITTSTTKTTTTTAKTTTKNLSTKATTTTTTKTTTAATTTKAPTTTAKTSSTVKTTTTTTKSLATPPPVTTRPTTTTTTTKKASTTSTR